VKGKAAVKDRGRAIKPRYPLPGEKFTVKEPVAPYLREASIQAVEDRGCSPRIARLRQGYFKDRPAICIHRARTYTEVYKETEGEPTVIRRGKAFKRYCEEKPIIIQGDELIVGNPGCRPRYVTIVPDYAWRWALSELETMSTRAADPYLISEEQKRELREEIFPYWKGKSVQDYILGHLPPAKRLPQAADSTRGVGHGVPGFAKVLQQGFKGIEETAKKTLSKLSYANPQDHEKIHFLEGVILSCQGMKILGERHANEARRLAEIEENRERKKELLEIAEICDWVPYNPARTFHEAVQTCWFVEVSTKIVESSTGKGLGRFDQYMYPYYERDMKEGRLTKEKAQELIECLWIKSSEIVPVCSESGAKVIAGYQPYQNVNVGGLTKNGLDATNELSYMCLQATYNTRLNNPSLTALVHKNSPDKFLMKAAEVIRTGCGMPQIDNVEVAAKQMLACGVSTQDANYVDIFGCAESNVQGKMWKTSGAYDGVVNLGLALEHALNDGYERMDRGKERWELATGDPRKFKTYEEVEDAFKKQVAHCTRCTCIDGMVAEEANIVVCPDPVHSATLEGPVERGIDYLNGGCTYNVGPAVMFIGLADVANSLAVIKKLVFEDKVLTMEELIDLLDTNFEGREDLRLLLLNRGPKYGRDDDYVDDIARRVSDFCAEEPSKYTSIRGCKFCSNLFNVSANTPAGAAVGALPSGRKAGTPLTDSASPQQGTDKSPTEVIKSVTKWDHAKHLNGDLVNMNFSPSVFEGERGLRNFVSLLRTFIDRGGFQIQFNIVDAATLKDAQKHPEKYTSLMVRVAGYSAYFNELCKETQDDIISRTEHTFV